MTQTLMAHLNLFLNPYQILLMAQEKLFREIFSFFLYHESVCCVYSLESHHRVHTTYHYCIEDQKHFPKLSPYAS